MIMFIISQILSAWFAFFLPCYATFKALSRRPLDVSELQKSCIYWSVAGAFVAVTYTAEWFISWLPFYWELKTAFLLFLALPQTQGSTWVYETYLQPFFAKNEAELDAGIVAIQRNILTFIQAKLTALWNFIWSFADKSRPQGQAAGQPQTGTQGGASGLASLLSPEVVRTALNFLQPASQQSATSTPNMSRQQSNVSAHSSSTEATTSGFEKAPAFPVPQTS
ncbi:TB2/DP1, HVA22 family-domain-containing protein [Panaeolus papilionaceus]|nr:TB2/DP1, HVA22 family-domain-containing protein [Panaeolus papilionaceus]